MESSIQQHGNHTMVSISGDIDYFYLSQFSDLMKQFTNTSNINLIVDLQNVTFMDSSSIGILITSFKKIKKNEGDLVLVNVPNDILTLLYTGAIDKFITIYASIEDVPS